MVARALEELPPLRERVDAYVARLAIFDDSVRTSLTNLTERTTEIEHAAQAGRAATATMRQELAEQRRVDDARAARLSSIEERVLTIEKDARLAELRLLVDRLEMRLLAKERENESLRAYIETRMATLEASLREQNVGNTVPPLRSISGIGPKLEAKLNAKGVADIQALAALSKDEREKLSKELGIARSKLEAWCESARRR
jgi:predicted flap endonuclease-1-like 5' DNA nuclease